MDRKLPAEPGTATLTREHDPVELVAADGTARGVTTVAAAHQPPGLLHRAYSVVLVGPDGRLLLQRRAEVKTRFPLRWANTCCGHPAPGEAVTEAASRRLTEELGVTGVPLREIGVYQYQAGDPATGWVEHEYDHVLLGRVGPGARIDPDPAEVAEIRWATGAELFEILNAYPDTYAPWFGGVLRLLATTAGPDWTS